MFELLVKETLGHLTLSLQRDVVRDLKANAKEVLTKQVAEAAARAILKGVDGVVAVAVNNLSRRDAQKLLDGYTEHLGQELSELFDALDVYIPLQLNVELAKAAHGNDSAEVNKARSERKAGIDEFKEEFRDLFRVIVGDEPKD
jgi:hypothetical protein